CSVKRSPNTGCMATHGVQGLSALARAKRSALTCPRIESRSAAARTESGVGAEPIRAGASMGGGALTMGREGAGVCAEAAPVIARAAAANAKHFKLNMSHPFPH